LKRLNLQCTTEAAQETAEREVQLLSTLKHPNIVTYVESCLSWDLYLNIIMHYCEGGDLYTKIREKEAENQLFEELKVVEWCIQICMALQYIHEKHIVHRDLKTQNIFLTKYEIIKIGDFGISK
jgi:NIMA (never in mitosis gene a)-related kinase